MAAYLLYIKTKTLLAVEEEVTELEQLMSSLEKAPRKGFSGGREGRAADPCGLRRRGPAAAGPGPQEPVSPAAERVYDYRHKGADLLRALYSVFSRSDAKLPGPPEMRALAPQRLVYGVRDKSREILGILGKGPVTLRSLSEAGRSRFRGRGDLPLRAGALLHGQRVHRRSGRASCCSASPAAIRRVFWKPLRNDYG